MSTSQHPKLKAALAVYLLVTGALVRPDTALSGPMFLQSVEITHAVQTAWASAPTEGDQRIGKEYISPDEPLFVFAAIGDSHISLARVDNPKYMEAVSISRELLGCYVRDINAYVPSVGFTVQLGDLTHSGERSQFEAARSILDSLESPLYTIVGNHDNMQSDNKQGWKDFAGMDSTNYTFDWLGFHFVVIDCTGNPYPGRGVECDSVLRRWAAADLAANRDKPTFVLSHFNMWERGWSAKFDTTGGYREYCGMRELRQVLEEAGNVLAIINGHVHANRVEVHSGIYYVDTSATLVGPPSIKYFHVYPDSVVVTSAYISDGGLFDHVVSLCPRCTQCFDPLRVCDFIDGSPSDKECTIHRK